MRPSRRRAPAAVVDGARRRRAELAEQEATLVRRIADLTPGDGGA